MKKISVCKNQQIIFGHVVPTGAIYGKFTYNYVRRIVTGYTFVHDKNNRQIFNKNGTPKMRAIIKEVPTTNTLIYSVESFLDYTFKKGDKRRYLYAWVLFDNGKKWQEIAIGTTPVTQELEKMVRDYIKEHELKEPKRPHVKTKNIESLAPKFREANQFDPVFRMRPENTNTINEELKFNTHCSAASNLKKCHSYDDRPIVRVKSRNYDDSKVVHPENGGYIRNENGTITTRNGEKVEITVNAKPCHESKPKTVIVNNKNRKPAKAGYHYAG